MCKIIKCANRGSCLRRNEWRQRFPWCWRRRRRRRWRWRRRQPRRHKSASMILVLFFYNLIFFENDCYVVGFGVRFLPYKIKNAIAIRCLTQHVPLGLSGCTHIVPKILRFSHRPLFYLHSRRRFFLLTQRVIRTLITPLFTPNNGNKAYFKLSICIETSWRPPCKAHNFK